MTPQTNTVGFQHFFVTKWTSEQSDTIRLLFGIAMVEFKQSKQHQRSDTVTVFWWCQYTAYSDASFGMLQPELQRIG